AWGWAGPRARLPRGPGARRRRRAGGGASGGTGSARSRPIMSWRLTRNRAVRRLGTTPRAFTTIRRPGRGREGRAMYQHLFAIVERLPAFWSPPASSLGPVGVRHVDELQLISSSCDGPPDANARALGSHHDVVRSTLDAAAVLP